VQCELESVLSQTCERRVLLQHKSVRKREQGGRMRGQGYREHGLNRRTGGLGQVQSTGEVPADSLHPTPRSLVVGIVGRHTHLQARLSYIPMYASPNLDFVRGTLEELFQEARYGRKRIESIDCFNYLKELMWGVHILHEKYNLIHRALIPSNILIDQNGQLKLAYYAFCIPCYDTQG